jgi:hypothetical protein
VGAAFGFHWGGLIISGSFGRLGTSLFCSLGGSGFPPVMVDSPPPLIAWGGRTENGSPVALSAAAVTCVVNGADGSWFLFLLSDSACLARSSGFVDWINPVALMTLLVAPLDFGVTTGDGKDWAILIGLGDAPVVAVALATGEEEDAPGVGVGLAVSPPEPLHPPTVRANIPVAPINKNLRIANYPRALVKYIPKQVIYCHFTCLQAYLVWYYAIALRLPSFSSSEMLISFNGRLAELNQQIRSII